MDKERSNVDDYQANCETDARFDERFPGLGPDEAEELDYGGIYGETKSCVLDAAGGSQADTGHDPPETVIGGGVVAICKYC
jgi:hypothetical protein